MRPKSHIGQSAVVCVLVAAVACASAAERTPNSVPATTSTPINSFSTCVDAGEGGLPYSFCLPKTWRVGDIIHSDGSMDIVMIDGTGEPFGFGKASGPVQPSGDPNRFVPFPKRLSSTQGRRRFLTELGFNAKVVRDLSIETIAVDGRSGSLLGLTIDLGDSQARSRVIEARVPVGSGAGIDLLFVWDHTKADDDVIREVISTLRIDAPMVDALLRNA